MKTEFKYTCQQLGLCQWREPACGTCPNQTAPLTIELVEEAPTWRQVFASWLPPRDYVIGIAVGAIALLVMGHTQQVDDNARMAERARAEKLGYQKGYHTGSNAGLIAAHKSCKDYLHLNHCDQVLAAAQVVAANEVQP